MLPLLLCGVHCPACIDFDTRYILADNQPHCFRRARPERHPLFPASWLVWDMVPVLGAPLAEQVLTVCKPQIRPVCGSKSS